MSSSWPNIPVAAGRRRLEDDLMVTLRLLQIRGKAMADRSGDLLELFHDVLLEARLDDRERFRQVSAAPPTDKRGCSDDTTCCP